VITNVAPPIRRVITPLVPKLNADGNEIGGVPSLLHRLPLGTNTGWNPIPDGAMRGREKTLTVAMCRSQRPRPSVSRRAIRGCPSKSGIQMPKLLRCGGQAGE
jgi:hypothetical protein